MKKWTWDMNGQFWYDDEGNNLSPGGCMREKNYLKEVMEEIRDLARTGIPTNTYGLTSLAEWDRYKINRIAGMANDDLGKEE